MLLDFTQATARIAALTPEARARLGAMRYGWDGAEDALFHALITSGLLRATPMILMDARTGETPCLHVTLPHQVDAALHAWEMTQLSAGKEGDACGC